MRKNKFRSRLIVCIVVPILVLFVLLTVCLNLILRPYLEELLNDRISYSAEQRADQLESLKTQLYSTAQGLIGNEELQESLVNGSDSIYSKRQFNRILRAYVFDDIQNISYLSNDRTHLSHALHTRMDLEWILDLVEKSDVDRTYSKPVWIFADDGRVGAIPQLYVLHRLRHLSQEAQPGYLLYHINQDAPARILSKKEEGERVLILDEKREVLYPNALGDERENAMLALAESGKISVDPGLAVSLAGSFVTSNFWDEKTGWMLFSYIDYDVLLAPYNNLQAAITGITFTIILLSIVIILWMTFEYTRPISVIVDALNSFKDGRFQTRISTTLPDEFGVIGDTFNRMADRTNALLADVEKSREDLKISELDSLMYQINPHFIYNTLDNIYMLARLSKQPQMAELIDSLSRFLRISLSKGSSVVTARDEMEHVSSFLAIQKARYGELFDYETQMDFDVSQAVVLKFILQPFVENSIQHGFSGLQSGGKICVRVFREEDGVCFELCDNGNGMPEAVLEKLHSIQHLPPLEINNIFPQQQGGYGIGNVIARLHLYYAAAFELHFENLNPGTKCTITVPFAKTKKEM